MGRGIGIRKHEAPCRCRAIGLHLWYPSQAWGAPFLWPLSVSGRHPKSQSTSSGAQLCSLGPVNNGCLFCVGLQQHRHRREIIPWHLSLRKSLYGPDPHFPYIKDVSAHLEGTRGSRRTACPACDSGPQPMC